jgi:hypothetical protein
MRYQEANDRSPAAAHAWPAKTWWSLWKNAQHLPLIIHCDTRKR